MQVPRRVDLRPEDTGQLAYGERAEGGIVQHPRAVDDRCRRVRGQEGADGLPVGEVARRDGDFGAQVRQFGAQRGGSGGVRSAAAGEHETPDAVRGDEMPGDESTERARTAGDQHGRVVTTERSAVRPVRRRRDTDQPRYPHSASPDCRLGFARGGQGGGVRGDVGSDVGEQNPSGVLRLSRPHKAGDGGGRRMGERLTRQGDRSPGDHEQPAGYEPLFRQPLLYDTEGAGGQFVGAGHHVSDGRRALPDEDGGLRHGAVVPVLPPHGDGLGRDGCRGRRERRPPH